MLINSAAFGSSDSFFENFTTSTDCSDDVTDILIKRFVHLLKWGSSGGGGPSVGYFRILGANIDFKLMKLKDFSGFFYLLGKF